MASVATDVKRSDLPYVEVGSRAWAAIQMENQLERYADPPTREARCHRVIVARFHAAAGTRWGACRLGAEHYYPDHGHVVVVDEPEASTFREVKRAGWVEFYGVADGYVSMRWSGFLADLAAAAGVTSERASVLVHIVDPAGRILHIGSMHAQPGRSVKFSG